MNYVWFCLFNESSNDAKYFLYNSKFEEKASIKVWVAIRSIIVPFKFSEFSSGLHSKQDLDA
jgi:hypothetical protein